MLPCQGSVVQSLQDMCFRVVVKYLNCLEDVGDLDERMLSRILRHCNEHQLRQIERGTKGRDLTGVVDPAWRSLFLLRFGQEATQERTAWMKRERLLFTWRQLYDAKEADQKAREEEAARRLAVRLKQIEEESSRMHVKVLTPRDTVETVKRKPWGSSGGSGRSSFIKKAKVQITSSLEGRIMKDIKTKRTATPAALRSTPAPPASPSNDQRSIQATSHSRSRLLQRPATSPTCPSKPRYSSGSAHPASSMETPSPSSSSRIAIQVARSRQAQQKPRVPAGQHLRQVSIAPSTGSFQGSPSAQKAVLGGHFASSSLAQRERPAPERVVVLDDRSAMKRRFSGKKCP